MEENDEAKTLGRLTPQELLSIMEEIGSNQTDCLSVHETRSKLKALKTLSKEILQHIFKNCWCMEQQLADVFKP